MKKYRAEGGVAVARSHRIEHDEDNNNIRADWKQAEDALLRNTTTTTTATATVHLIKPIAVRVVDRALPVSQAESAAFYHQTEHLLPLSDVHQCFAESQQWYRYYTQEEGSFSPGAYMMTRELGARNPSPGGGDHHHPKRRLAAEEVSDDDQSVEEEAEPMIILRPSPLRVHKPTPVRVVPQNQHPHHHDAAIPQLIQDRDEGGERCVSPITLYSSQSNTTAMPQQMVVPMDHANCLPRLICAPQQQNLLEQAKEGLLQALAVHGGDTSSPEFAMNLDLLIQHAEFQSSEGLWLTLTKPTFFDNLGDNDQGDPMYKLSRMSFDMFSPADLICSLQGNFNEVERVCSTSHEDIVVPKKLRDEVRDAATVLRTYNVITAFTIEPPQATFPDAPNSAVTRPIRGVMTTYGYQIADPDANHRDSVWITGGKIEPNTDPRDVADWKKLFGQNPPNNNHHSMGAHARLLAVKLLMGAELPHKMEEDGSLHYAFTRPLGGHGLAYIDTLYCDDSLRVVRGHRGTLFCFCRMPDPN